MSIETLLNVTASPTLIGKATRLRYGLPSTNLLRYYGMTDGDVGSAPTTFTDLSGNSDPAAMLSGASTVLRTNGGVTVDDTYGMAFDSGVVFEGTKTVLIATRDLNAAQGTDTALFNMFSGPTSRIAVPMSDEDQANAAPGPYLLSNAYPAGNPGARRLYSGSTPTWESGSNVKNMTMETDDFAAWIIAAYSFRMSDYRMTFTAHNSTNETDTYETTVLANAEALASTIAFGSWQHQGDGVAAELGLFGIWDQFMTASELRTLCARAAAVMETRGETVPYAIAA